MKNVVLHTTLMHCKATQVLRDLFSTNQQNLWQELLKLASEIWKPRYNRRFTWACILKASKSSLQLSAINWPCQLDKIFLTHFMPLIYFDSPWKHQKTYGFLMFLGVSKEISGTKWVSICDDCLVYLVFKEYLSVVATKYRICDTENNT